MFAVSAIAQDRNLKHTYAEGTHTHEITAQTEYISALLLARVHRLPQCNDAIRSGISAFHNHMQICHKV